MDILINNILKRKKKISIFPIPESDWKDSGTWDNYFSAIKTINIYKKIFMINLKKLRPKNFNLDSEKYYINIVRFVEKNMV